MDRKKLIQYGVGVVIILFALASLLALATTSTKNTSSNASAPDSIPGYKWREYKNSSLGYAVNYPDDWKTSSTKETVTIYNSTNRPLSITVYKNKSVNNIPEITKTLKGGCQRAESVTFGLNVNGQKLYCTGQSTKEELINYFAEHNGKLYQLSYTDIFDDSYKLLERMIETFRYL